MRDRWFVLHTQPEPWATPPHGVGRKNGGLFVTTGSNQELVAYQEEIRELMRSQITQTDIFCYCVDDAPAKLTFYYCRQLGRGIQHADATNLNKALEDALQGILYGNDRIVRDVRGAIVSQDNLVTDPWIAIHFQDFFSSVPITKEIPEEVLEDIQHPPRIVSLDENVWPPKT